MNPVQPSQAVNTDATLQAPQAANNDATILAQLAEAQELMAANRQLLGIQVPTPTVQTDAQPVPPQHDTATQSLVLDEEHRTLPEIFARMGAGLSNTPGERFRIWQMMQFIKTTMKQLDSANGSNQTPAPSTEEKKS